MCLPFMMTPSITALSSLNDQYGLMSWCSWSLLSGQPAIIKHLVAANAHLVQVPVVFAGSTCT